MGSAVALFMLGGLIAQAQLSPSAYRVLGQPDLRQNGLNMVLGSELLGPSGIALDANEGPLHLYVADTRNHRVLAWQDARSFQNGGAPTLVLGQPTPQNFSSLGIGVKGFVNPLGLAVDPVTGNLYVADFGDNRVLRFPRPFANSSRIEPDAVYGQSDFTGRTANAGGITDHSMNGPRGVAFDSKGNLWVADTGNHRILRFSAGVLDGANPAADLVIGQEDFTSGSTNHGLNRITGQGLDRPGALAFDGQDNLYVSDSNNLRVLRFASPLITNQSATTVLGQASLTARAAASRASASTFAGPVGLAVSGGGNLYVTDSTNNRVLVFVAAATMPSGSQATAVLGQPDFTTTLPNTNAAPRASASSLNGASDVKLDPDGNVFVVDTGNHRVVAFAPNATSASRVWGQPDFSANGPNQIKPSSINAPYKIAIDYSRSPFALYVSDTNNHRVLIWKDAISFHNGAPADLVIGQPDGSSGDANVDTAGQRPSRTSLSEPRGIAVDADGTLYVADTGNHRVLRFPRPVAQSGRITPDAVIGQLDFTTSASAVVTASSLNRPSGLAIGPNGNLFVSDSGNNRVMEFAAGAAHATPALRVYGQPDFTTRTAPPSVTAQTLSNPQGLYVDGSYTLYVVDSGANRMVAYSNTKDLPPVGASASIVIGQEDFNTGAATRLKVPLDITADSNGRLYVSDTANNRVLVFPSLLFLPISGAAPTAAIGQPNLTVVLPNWNSRDGLATPEGLSSPAGLCIDRQDTLYVGDTGNNRVVHILKQAAVVNAAHFLANVPVAPGTILSLFGEGLAGESAGATALPLPRSLVRREVVVNDEIKAPLLYLSPGQINFQLPTASPAGTQRIGVRVAETGELVAGGSLLVGSSSPGFFSLSRDGKGQAAALNEDGTPNGASSPASRGTVVQLFGTGQGPVIPEVLDGEGAPSGSLAKTVAVPTSDGGACLSSQPSVCVAIGTTFGEVLYSGMAPGFVGVWQINVRIPASAQTGNVNVRAVINATPSNIVTLAIR